MVEDTEKHVWPEDFTEKFDESWPDLSKDDSTVERWLINNKQILMRVVTWNLCARPPPGVELLQKKVLPLNRFHVYLVGTEECERSIAQSALNPSKKNWELFLMECLGPLYVPIRSHTLQAIHLMAFVHKSIAHLCSFVTSAAVATGAGNTLGNKGGVGVFMKFASTKILVVNAHLAAHQNAEKQRNADFHKISKGLPALLEKRNAVLGPDATTSQQQSTISQSMNPTGTSGVDEQDKRGSIGAVSGREGVTVQGGESTEFQKTLAFSESPKTSDSNQPNPYESATSGPSVVTQPVEVGAPQEVQQQETAVPDDDDEDGDEVREETDDIGPSSVTNDAASSSAVGGSGSGRGLEQCADVVVFMGDLNYRIKGNRSVISGSIAGNMHDVLLHNDQLRSNMSRNLVLQHFIEPPLTFRPTYKLDIGSDAYDTGPKKRIPAWTDRILYVPNPAQLTCIAYSADTSVMTSDHRPVYASFVVQLNSYLALDDKNNIVQDPLTNKLSPQFTSESQVCTIM